MRQLSELMAVRICDLGLSLRNSHLWPDVLQLYQELYAKKIRFAPTCYFADEWFVPEGDPVIGIPFYLANKQLMRLEKKMIGEVEGETPAYFMKLLRHEAGHAISYAFRLHRRRTYQRIFGPSKLLFNDIYDYNPRSRDHVINLKEHYAQSHPDEDFAETFAVWLSTPEKNWRNKYKGWPALTKLMYVRDLMKSIENRLPLVRSGEKMCHVNTLKYTLWTYYMRRRSLLTHHKEGA